MRPVTTLFFLHGVGGGHAAWDRQVPYFTERGYRCVAWDQPGYGGTPLVEPYDFEQVVAALMTKLDEVPGEAGVADLAGAAHGVAVYATVRCGNAAGVAIRLNGENQGPFGKPGQVVRDILIKP